MQQQVTNPETQKTFKATFYFVVGYDQLGIQNLTQFFHVYFEKRIESSNERLLGEIQGIYSIASGTLDFVTRTWNAFGTNVIATT